LAVDVSVAVAVAVAVAGQRISGEQPDP